MACLCQHHATTIIGPPNMNVNVRWLKHYVGHVNACNSPGVLNMLQIFHTCAACGLASGTLAPRASWENGFAPHPEFCMHVTHSWKAVSSALIILISQTTTPPRLPGGVEKGEQGTVIFTLSTLWKSDIEIRWFNVRKHFSVMPWWRIGNAFLNLYVIIYSMHLAVLSTIGFQPTIRIFIIRSTEYMSM